jgi:AcrR family transcriptional regulator
MAAVTPSRRERLRTATVTEIRQTARRLLVAGGPSAISLRAIAREMGMTAPAIYRYFPSLEALVTQVCADLVDELNAAIDAARAPLPPDRPAERLAAMARAFRGWSVGHRAEFSLMFGEPIPGAPGLDARVADATGVPRLCDGFVEEFAALWRHHRFRVPLPEPGAARLARQLTDQFTALLTQRLAPAAPGAHGAGPEPPMDVVYVLLSGWVRLYGMVAMEVFGHLSWAVTDAEGLFEAEIAAFLRGLTG